MTRLRARRRVLTIGHSYAVGVNRRLAEEIARASDWDVTVVAPERFRGDFGWHHVEPAAGERCTIEAVPLHFGRRVHTMLYGRALTTLLRQRWDLVHCWEEPYVAAAAQVAATTSPRVPLVFATFQNIDKRYPPPFNWMEKYVLERADAVVAFGRTIADVLVGRGFPAARTCIISPGVDVASFSPNAAAGAGIRSRVGWSGDTPVVGFLGRFVPEKGLPALMRILDGTNAPWRALLVGNGPLEAEVRAWAAKHGDRVALATTVAHDEVPAYLNAMDVLCAPSQSTRRWREQFGRMIIEAFACGVPVVASECGEIPHVVGDAGIVLGEREERRWSDTLARLLENPGDRGELAARGRERAVSVFDWAKVGQRHVDLFSAMIDGRAIAAAGSAA